MSNRIFTPELAMERALQLATAGEGFVEPNPMVGAVIVDRDGLCLGEGYHQRFGGPHAEVHALQNAGNVAGSTLYVTLEPCCHFGKTPPCTEAVIQAGIRRVVVAALDPFPAVAGKGVTRLREAGIEVEVGLMQPQAIAMTAPFRKLVQQSLPFVVAKWAMTLDGKIAAHTGVSKWISNPKSRSIVHTLRGRMDGILVGIGTALADDPLLTARPTGPRTALRIVLDSQARLPLTSQLIKTIDEAPLLIVASESAPESRISALRTAGAEVLPLPPQNDGHPDILQILHELGRRRLTNLLVEGGSDVLGKLSDAHQIDEAHVFIAPKMIGGHRALSPIGGIGAASPAVATILQDPIVEHIDNDLYVHGRVAHSHQSE